MQFIDAPLYIMAVSELRVRDFYEQVCVYSYLYFWVQCLVWRQHAKCLLAADILVCANSRFSLAPIENLGEDSATGHILFWLFASFF